VIVGTALVVALSACDRETRDPVQGKKSVTGQVEPAGSAAVVRQDAHLITIASIGPVELGTSLGEARSAMPNARFDRSSDGEGVALVQVTLAAGESVIVWADEEDPASDIDWSKKIRSMETFSEVFHTQEGVHPGSLVADVEKRYGKTRSVEMSEIESRQYITFENQPAWLIFRLDYTGKFTEGSRVTTEVAPGGRIQSIAIAARR
jgi:hypothetical protein